MFLYTAVLYGYMVLFADSFFIYALFSVYIIA